MAQNVAIIPTNGHRENYRNYITLLCACFIELNFVNDVNQHAKANVLSILRGEKSDETAATSSALVTQRGTP